MIKDSAQYSYRPDLEERKAIFVASCVESAAGKIGVSAVDMYKRMTEVGLINGYVIPCYDVLHTESRKNLTEDLLKTLDIWEKKKSL